MAGSNKSSIERNSKITKKQTAGCDLLGDFAPKLAELNDNILFGQVWSHEEELEPKQRSLITISALIYAGNFEQLPAHINIGKMNGITKDEIVEVITHLSFYVGQLKGSFLVKEKKKTTIVGEVRELSSKSLSIRTSEGHR